MKKLIFCLLFAVVFTNLTAQEIKYPKMKNDVDSISFYIGLDIGASLRQMGMKMESDLIARGIEQAITLGDELDPTIANEFLRDYFMVRLPRQKLAETEAYLDDLVASNPRIQRTESGLLYEIIVQGDMNYRAVEDDDSVEVTYIGTLPDGTVFDENEEGVVFALNRVIRGWTEGMKLIGKGGRIKLYIHPDLGYGANGQGNGIIPPNAVLIFDVNLLDAPEV